ncbi:lysylphosphatidylglycerol synthase domain-containing protein [Castellaniella sp. GW247-6E4]|uniref:O-antigen ligase family protein n=1 Tax=Castellaniella sp. GW247-6E4 TaxID=3140380 RepID=UPI003315E5B5
MRLRKLVPLRFVALAVSFALLAGIFLFVRPENLLGALHQFPYRVLVGALVLIIINQLTVVHRYSRILDHFGHRVPWWSILRASMMGNMAALIVIPLMGHMLGRQAILRDAGVSPVENAMIVAYERVLVALVSATMAVLGGVHLLGSGVFKQMENIPFAEILLVLCIAGVLVKRLGLRGFERLHISTALAWRNVLHVLELVVVTAVSLGAMLSCFSVLFHVVAPEAGWLDLFAMAAIVSFGASIPLSFGGWGLREIFAIYVLGLFGVSSSAALSASIFCGALSIAGVLLLAGVATMGGRRGGRVTPPADRVPVEVGETVVHMEHASAWPMYMAVTVLIFFQIHVSVADTTVNLNLADPFAVLALSAVALEALSRRRWPQWSVPGLNAGLLTMWGVFVLGLGLAWWLRGGVSGWAVSKVIGWAALLGYMAAGYMAVRYYGRLGFRRLVETMVIVLCVVVVCAQALVPLHGFGLPGFLHGVETSGFEAYSGNRNALAFQLMVVMSLYLPLLGRMQRLVGGPWASAGKLSTVAFGILIGGLLLTASRSAFITFALMIGVVLVMRIAHRRLVVASLVVGVLIWLVSGYLPFLYKVVGDWVLGLFWVVADWVAGMYRAVMVWDSGVNLGASPTAALSGANPAQPWIMLDGVGRFSTGDSDQGRVKLMIASVDAWLRHPIIGGGLGSFLADSESILGFTTIIHNTLLWLMAEMGIVGAMPFVVVFVLIVRSAWIRRAHSIRAQGILLLMLVFAVMSLFHEVLYQRIFWLGLGALAAVGERSDANDGGRNPQ